MLEVGVIRIPYTKTNKSARDLKVNNFENAGIDLFPDVSTIEIPNEEVIKIQKISNTEVNLLVSYPGFYAFVTTPYKIALPKGIHGIVFGRSGNFFKSGIDVFHGVIDSSYRGVIKVGLKFYNPGIFNIKNDIAVAQLVLLGYNSETLLEMVEVSEEEFAEKHANTERGERGFGSSGHI
ncbi:hypothetical protein Tt72P_008 [Thermus phage T72]|nr:hypothetical protein Tt72P_008 [Thermus phage T72]